MLRRGGGRAGDQLLLEGWGRPGPAHDTGADDLDGDTPGPVLGRGVEGQDGVARDGPNLRDDVTTADPSAHVVDGVVVVEADQAAVVAVEPSDRSGGFVPNDGLEVDPGRRGAVVDAAEHVKRLELDRGGPHVVIGPHHGHGLFGNPVPELLAGPDNHHLLAVGDVDLRPEHDGREDLPLADSLLGDDLLDADGHVHAARGLGERGLGRLGLGNREGGRVRASLWGLGRDSAGDDGVGRRAGLVRDRGVRDRGGLGHGVRLDELLRLVGGGSGRSRGVWPCEPWLARFGRGQRLVVAGHPQVHRVGPRDHDLVVALSDGGDLDEAVPDVRGALLPDAVLHLEPEFGIPVAQEVPRANEHGLAVSLPAGHAEGDLDDAPVEGAVFLSGRGVGGRRRDAREHRAAGTLRRDGTEGCGTSRWHRLAPIFFVSRVRDPRRERRASGACGGHGRWPSRTFEPRTEEDTRGCLPCCAAPASGYWRRLARSRPLGAPRRFHDTAGDIIRAVTSALSKTSTRFATWKIEPIVWAKGEAKTLVKYRKRETRIYPTVVFSEVVSPPFDPD